MTVTTVASPDGPASVEPPITTTAPATAVTTAPPTSTTAFPATTVGEAASPDPPDTTTWSSTTAPASSPNSTTAAPATTDATLPQLDTGDITGFEIVDARLGDRSLRLALADTPALRSRGLMGVTSLGDLDGMLFAWDSPVQVSFWMKDTLIPLDIGFFDESGSLFLVVHMVPCRADPCPSYPSEAPIRYALESLPGFFDDVALEEILVPRNNTVSP
ncbi:MAG: DUF192 domain-containing protein [bacterium]|nr:DUF192 domain-containing protein [bacterium]